MYPTYCSLDPGCLAAAAPSLLSRIMRLVLFVCGALVLTNALLRAHSSSSLIDDSPRARDRCLLRGNAQTPPQV